MLPPHPAPPMMSLWLMVTLTLTMLCEGQVVEVGVADVSTGYGVMLDAGSTSTKLKIYKWTKSHTASRTLPHITLLNTTRFNPGLSEFTGVDNAMKLRPYLTDILKKAKLDVPAERHSSTPVYVYATAGLRYLPERISSRLLNNVRQLLADPALNPFRFTNSHVQVISGEEEGVYLWVAANFLNGFFGESKSAKSVGVMEMGGGSTQIAFVPDVPLYAEEFQVRVDGTMYSLYVQSYFNYGINGIRDQVTERLGPVPDPCMLHGDSRSTEWGVDLQGAGMPDQCEQILRDIIEPSSDQCQLKPCAVGHVYQPPLPNNTMFYGVGHAFALFKSPGSANKMNFKKMRKEAINHCKMNVSQIKQNRKYASSDCLMGLYVPLLLREAYGFPSDASNILATSRIGGRRIDWALGKMLLELSSLQGPRDDYVTPRKSLRSRDSKNVDSSVARHVPGRHFVVLFTLVCVVLRHMSDS